MALPKIQTPIHTFDVPSMNTKAKFRSMTVKEEKLLLMAKQDKDSQDVGMLSAISQVLNNCSIDSLDCSKLATVDLEYLFIQLRIVSIDNIVKLKYHDEEDGEIYEFEVDLTQIEVIKDPEFTDTFIISEDENETIGVKMKMIKAEDLVKFTEQYQDLAELTTDIVRLSIDQVFTDDEVVIFNECTVDEQTEFLESLSPVAYKKLKSFFAKCPRIVHTLEYTNTQGKTRTIVLEKISDFFTFR